MNTKFQFSIMNLKMFIILITIIYSFSSCVDETITSKDIDTNSPENFLYSTTQGLSIKVAVDDKFNGNFFYKVEVYDNNPFTTDTTSNLLCAGVAKRTMPFETKLVIPAHISTIYVKQIDPLNKQTVKIYSIGTSGSLTCDFAEVVSTNSSASKISRSSSVVGTSPKASDYSLPTSFSTLGSSAVTLDGTNFYVPSGVTNSSIIFGWNYVSSLYVAGEVIFNSDNVLSMYSNCKLVVLPGGKVTFNSPALFEQSGNIVAVHAGGVITFNQGGGVGSNSTLINDGTTNLNSAYEVRTNGQIINNGTIKGTQLTMTNSSKFVNNSNVELTTAFVMNSNTTFENNGTMKADGTLRTNNTTSIITNNGHISTNYFDMSSGGGVLYNNCSVECEDFSINGATVSSASGTIIENQDLYANLSTITLNGNAIFRTTNSGNNKSTAVSDGITFDYNVLINGIAQGNEKPLFTLWKLNKKDGWQSLQLAGTMEYCLAAGNTPGANFYKSISSGISFVETPTVQIASTTCNNGGINSNDGNPENPTFPIVVNEENEYVFSMEDMWPIMGDYDMNDVVFKIHNIKKSINADNKVVALSFDITPLASGSTRSIAAALQFEKINSTNISTFQSTFNGTYAENDQQKANYILFPKVHELFGRNTPIITNTYNHVSKINSKTYTFNFGFSTPVDAEFVNINELNFYTITGEVNTANRQEIHLAGYNPSSKVKSATNSYKDANNMIWGIMIPVSSYKHPTEATKISDAYPQFSSWATSGGLQNKDWYLHPANGLVYTK